jgi:hypothetical protein
VSDGYRYGEFPPTKPCPYCQTRCDADFVDIGVGMVQCGPYHCVMCGASEIGAYDSPRPLSEDEVRTGWYAPGEPPSDKANVVGGKVVSHQVMRDMYRDRFYQNPEHSVPGAVERWREDLRRPRHG